MAANAPQRDVGGLRVAHVGCQRRRALVRQQPWTATRHPRSGFRVCSGETPTRAVMPATSEQPARPHTIGGIVVACLSGSPPALTVETEDTHMRCHRRDERSPRHCGRSIADPCRIEASTSTSANSSCASGLGRTHKRMCPSPMIRPRRYAYSGTAVVSLRPPPTLSNQFYSGARQGSPARVPPQPMPTPAGSAVDSTSSVTTLPASTVTPAPMVRNATTTTRCSTAAPRSTVAPCAK